MSVDDKCRKPLKLILFESTKKENMLKLLKSLEQSNPYSHGLLSRDGDVLSVLFTSYAHFLQTNTFSKNKTWCRNAHNTLFVG